MSPAPAEGMVRVLAAAGVGNLRATRWADVPESDPRLAVWLDAGLVRLTGFDGSPPPDDLPSVCCSG